jgi:hypothetical protein
MFAATGSGATAEKVSPKRKDDRLQSIGTAASSHFVMPGLWHGEIGLAGEPTSAREARAFVRSSIGDEVSGSALQDVLLVASEMVSNVIRHAQTPLTLSLELHSSYVRLAVTDGEPPFDAVAETAVDAESGRGMGIIGSISRGWGVGDTPIGKSIWAEIPLT